MKTLIEPVLGSEDRVKGKVEAILYSSAHRQGESGHYVILSLKTSRGKIKIVGNFDEIPHKGNELEILGQWEEHERYGRQLVCVSNYNLSTEMPTDEDGLEAYLSSGMIKGIGPKTARRIINKYGKDTIEVMDKNITDLLSIPGISQRVLDKIKVSWLEQSQNRYQRDIMIYLRKLGVTPKLGAKIIKHFSMNTIPIIESTPYRLVEIPGVSFKRADEIAIKSGVSYSDPLRIEAGLIYILSEVITEKQHVCCPYQKLFQLAKELLDIDESLVHRSINEAEKSHKIISDKLDGGIYYYSPKFYLEEKNVARELLRINNYPGYKFKPPSEVLADINKKLFFKLSGDQEIALQKALYSKVVILTGGPGTGKSTLINALLKIFMEHELKILLAAPTGRAAKRMSELSGGHPAKTIHRLLGWKRDGTFKYSRENALDCEVVIVDESSMLDISLMYCLVQAIPSTARLILVGDVNQLPSVGPGNVLRDIINSEKFLVLRLTTIHRQNEGSAIIENSQRVLKGIMPINGDDFHMKIVKTPEDAVGLTLGAIEYLKREKGYDPLKDIQVLSPEKKKVGGVKDLNARIKSKVNPTDLGIERDDGVVFSLNDRVMQRINNYEKDVFNGDVGWINSVDVEDNSLTVLFEDRIIPYLGDGDELFELMPAYACTIHKSQGSEYPIIIVVLAFTPISGFSDDFHQRNLLYTAITRGKDKVIVICKQDSLEYLVRNDTQARRYTFLHSRLKTELPSPIHPEPDKDEAEYDLDDYA